MATAVVITGSNAARAEEYIAQAREAVADVAGKITTCSPVMRSEPWGAFEGEEATPDFLNQVLVIDTPLLPDALLDALQRIEDGLGRKRTGESKQKKGAGEVSYNSRTMDIDILFYDDAVMDTERLVIPHPLIAQREFVLEPLAAVLPRFTHPVTGETVEQMLKRHRDGMRRAG